MNPLHWYSDCVYGPNDAANVFIVIRTTNDLVSFAIGFLTKCFLFVCLPVKGRQAY